MCAAGAVNILSSTGQEEEEEKTKQKLDQTEDKN